MAERPAVNASPLILLSQGGRLDFLQLAGEEIVVPEAVAEEIQLVEWRNGKVVWVPPEETEVEEDEG